MQYRITSDWQSTLAALDGNAAAATRAIRSAMARTIRTARAEATRAIVDRYSVSAGDVRAAIEAKSKPAENSIVGEIVGKGARIPLARFPHSPSSPGTGGRGRPPLYIEIVRGERKPIPGAFVMRSDGATRIAQRQSRARFPVRALSTIPIPMMLGVLAPRITEHAQRTFTERLAHEIGRATKGAK